MAPNLILSYFNLRDQPFGVTPDPSYLFDTPAHREALAGLLYGIDSGLGFIALTAEPGMGKTTILLEALARLGEKARTVFLFQTIHNPTELFRALLIDLGEKDPHGTLIDMEMRLNEMLVELNESGQRLVVVLDEAQNLDYSVLEAVRMLSNFETAHDKLLQIILCGQQQLADRLAEPELLQLRQRISIFATLQPLTRLETANYIDHRLKVAGYESTDPLFTAEAVSLIAYYSGGIPRNINNLCFNALSICCASRKNAIDAEIVREAICDLGMQAERIAEPIGVAEAETGSFAPSDLPDRSEGLDLPDRSDRDRSGRSDFSEPRDSWAGLRVALIAALLLAAAVAGGRWYLAHSGTLPSALTSRASSTVQDTPPMRDQGPATAPATAPAAAQSDLAVQSAATPLEDRQAQPPAASQDGSSPQAADAAQAPATAEAEAPAPAAERHAKRIRKKTVFTGHSSPPMTALGGGVQVVKARQGQSIVGICVEKFNGCSSVLLNRIIELNPRIADAHHLQAGQRIFLPVLGSQREAGDRRPSGE